MYYFIDNNGIIRGYDSPEQAKRGLTLISESEAIKLAELKDEIVEAQQWVKGELSWCDVQRAYHMTGDTKRAIAKLEDVNQYAILCRDYVYKDSSGEFIINTFRPKRPN